MTTVQTRLMSAEEFYEWANRPENRGRVCELERGVIVEMSRPGKLHGLICANVAGILRNYVAARKKGYVCSNDTGVVVEGNPDTVRGPDVLLFDDVETIDEVEEKYGDKPPLLAVEVLSQNDTYAKVVRRIQEQFHFGTREVWILDPDSRDVIIHTPDRKDRVVGESQELTDDLLPGFRCRVAEFFALPGR
jgi:Uma2 family endonuclease